MAKASMALAELVEKGADTDVLRQMIQYVAQRLMDLDVEGLCGAGYGERSAERTNAAMATGIECGIRGRGPWS